MNWINTIKDRISTKRGILLFLTGLLSIWLIGYYLISYIYIDDWIRFTRQLYFSRFTILLAILIMVIATVPNIRKTISETKRTATDLAVFRILFFGFFAIGLIIYPNSISDQITPFIDLPESAQVALPFMGWYPKLIPINHFAYRVFSLLFYISIFTSLLGIKTRWSISIFTISLFYLFMIPNLYGKVNHNHHLIWFPAILAFSPCADRFSIDAFLRNRKGLSKRHSTKSYTLPFLFIWGLIGIIYFFPGFWKIWSNGLDWVLTDNIRNQMYYKWFQLGDSGSWLPFFRVDQHPILYKGIGLFTVLFEISFIPLLFNKSTRKIAIASGLLFHFGTWLFMNIFFVVLVWSYLSFVKWSNFSFFAETKEVNTDLKEENWGVKIVGITLILFNLLFGLGKWYSYPFTTYPTFDSIVQDETFHLIYEGKTKNGELIRLPNKALHDKFTSPRYWEMENDIIENRNKNKSDSLLLKQLCDIQMISDHSIDQVNVFIELQSIIPEKRQERPKELIYSTIRR